MRYDFMCDLCPPDRAMLEVRAPLSEGPPPQVCPLHGGMRRIYGDAQVTIYHGRMYDYMDMAYRGETEVPGMSTAQVRAIMDTDMATARRGRANSARTRKAKTLR